MGIKLYHNGQWVEFGSGGGFEGTTYQLKCTKDSDGGSTGTDADPYLFLDASSGNDDSIQITGGTNCSVNRNDDGKLTIDVQGAGASGAAGSDKQVQFNDGGSTLAGANGLEFEKYTSTTGFPILILKPSSSESTTYGGGRISAQTNDASDNDPYNRATITADGGLELMRRRVVDPIGGPYIDFKSGQVVDFDSRIQMDYTLESGSINTDSADYSAITFQTGGKGYYSTSNPTNPNGRVIERLRIGKAGEIGILAGPKIGNGDVANNRTDAQKYGNVGEVLTSNGKGNSVSWTSKGTPSGSVFTTGLQVNIPATQPPVTLDATVNIANFNSNTGSNQSKLLIYNVRRVAATSWENTAMVIQRQVDNTNFGYIRFGDGLGNQANGHTLCFGNSAERLKITADGNIGIGIANPSGMLEVQKNGVPAIISNYNNSKHIQMDAGASGAGFQLTTGHYFAINHQPYANRGTNTNLTERLRIDATGNILCSSSTAYFGLPRVTTSGKSSLSNLVDGSVIYNTTENRIEVRVSGSWRQVTTENI